MTDSFISLKEAQTYTGKSRSTLRRFITTITGPDSHPDRELIHPSVEEVKELHAANRPFSWTVSVSLLDRAFKVAEQKASQSAGESSSNENATNNSANNELLRQTIGMLKTELDEKNKQIAQFQERQHETNVLLKQTTEQLTMLTESPRQPEPRPDYSDAVEASEEGSPSDSQKSKPKKQTKSKRSKKKATPAKKPTLWERMNRPLFPRS